jgi:excisionase family DNA binding protein
MEKRFAPPRDIARIFSVGSARVYEALRDGYVGYHKVGNRYLVSVADFDAYIRAQPRADDGARQRCVRLKAGALSTNGAAAQD